MAARAGRPAGGGPRPARRRARAPRAGAPRVDDDLRASRARSTARPIPDELRLEPGALDDAARRARPLPAPPERGVAAARSSSPPPTSLGSTSVNAIGGGFADGYWNAQDEPRRPPALDRRHLRGRHHRRPLAASPPTVTTIGVGSSYGAFMAPLGHIAARLHAIGAQARRVGHRRALQADLPGLRPRRPEDRRGRPHARRPAAAAAPAGELPAGHGDLADAVGAAGDLAAGRRPRWRKRPARHRAVRDAAQRDGARPRRRSAWRPPRPRPPASTCCVGHRSTRRRDAWCCRRAPSPTPSCRRRCRCSTAEGIDALVYYVASAELFDLLPAEEQRAIFPEERAREAMGITGFTLPTLYRWVTLRRRPRREPAPLPQAATTWAAARARWCWPRPASTARASTAPSGPTWTHACGPRSRSHRAGLTKPFPVASGASAPGEVKTPRSPRASQR